MRDHSRSFWFDRVGAEPNHVEVNKTIRHEKSMKTKLILTAALL